MGTSHQDQHSNAGFGTADIGCSTAVELLPWLLNDTLESDEREQLLGHLDSCEGCRLELDETAAAAQLMSQHIPSLALAQYAHGLEPSGLSRERLEKHLALCSSCRQELELATPGQVIDLGAARIERSITALRSVTVRKPDRVRRAVWGVAASIALALISGAMILDWQGTAGTTPSPTAEVQPVERHEPGNVLDAKDVFNDGFESGSITTWSSVAGHGAIGGTDS